MKFIVARPVPLTKAQQRRRHRRPDSFNVRQSERTPMNDQRLDQLEPSGTGRTTQPALFRSVLSGDRGLSRNETIACRQPSRPRYLCTSHAFTDWTMQRIDELAAECQDPPLVVPLTVTFAPNS